MKRYSLSLLMALALPFLGSGADKGAVTFYLQLVRGTDDDKPPAPEATVAGPALCHRLRMFKWKHYWEIAHRTVVLDAGGITRQRLSAQREVGIALSAPAQMTVCIYTDGKLTRLRKQALDTPFYIDGGDNAAQSWFIVVRRDKPPAAQAKLN